MAKVNIPASGHGNKVDLGIRYNVFPTATAIDKQRLNKVNDAYHIVNNLDKKIDLHGPCNKYFQTLAKGKTFRHYWRDNSIFINFSPSLVNGFYGATHTNDKDVCISAWCLDNCNRWMVAATLVHELAHIAGAPGGASHSAEKAVDKCSFKQQYDPRILGSIRQLGNYIENAA